MVSPPLTALEEGDRSYPSLAPSSVHKKASLGSSCKVIKNVARKTLGIHFLHLELKYNLLRNL